uniref:Uncharacterized protein n=1 Tax=Arundo donax TaxID=35708 RepID=A0A0A9H019_ARUDO
MCLLTRNVVSFVCKGCKLIPSKILDTITQIDLKCVVLYFYTTRYSSISVLVSFSLLRN